MSHSTIFPKTAEFLENNLVVTIADFSGDHYAGILPDRLNTALLDGRIRSRTDHEMEYIIDHDNDVVGYRVRKARYHLIVDPVADE